MGNPFSKGRYTQRVPNTQRNAINTKRAHLSSKIDQVYSRQGITWGQKVWLKYYLKDLESLFRNYEDETKEEHLARIASIMRRDWRITARDDDTMEIVQKLSKYHRIRPNDTEIASLYYLSDHLRQDDAIPFEIISDGTVDVRQTREEARRASAVQHNEIHTNQSHGIVSRIRAVSTESHTERDSRTAGSGDNARDSKADEENMCVTTMNTLDVIYTLNKGDIVHVCKIQNRFAEIKFPVCGWIQTINAHGKILAERQGTIEDRAKYISTAQTLDRDDESKHGPAETLDDVDFLEQMTTYSANATHIALEASPIPLESGIPEPDPMDRHYSVHQFHPDYFKLDGVTQRGPKGQLLHSVLPPVARLGRDRAESSGSADGDPIIVMSEPIPYETNGRERVHTNSSANASGTLLTEERVVSRENIPEPKVGFFEPLHTNDEPPSTTNAQTVVRFGEGNRQSSYKGAGDSHREISEPVVFSQTGSSSVSSFKSPSLIDRVDSDEPIMGFMEPITGGDGHVPTQLQSSSSQPQKPPESQETMGGISGERFKEMQGVGVFQSASSHQRYSDDDGDEPKLVMSESIPDGDETNLARALPLPVGPMHQQSSPLVPFSRGIPNSNRLVSAPVGTSGVSGERYNELQGGVGLFRDPVILANDSPVHRYTDSEDEPVMSLGVEPVDGSTTTSPVQPRDPFSLVNMNRPPSPMQEGRSQAYPAFSSSPLDRAISAASAASAVSASEIDRPGSIVQMKTSSLLDIGRSSDPIVTSEYAEKHEYIYGEVIAMHEASVLGESQMARVYAWPETDTELWDEPFAVNVPTSAVERLPFELQRHANDSRSCWGESSQVQLWSTEHGMWCDSEVRTFTADLSGVSSNDRLQVKGFLEVGDQCQMINSTLERSSKYLRARCVGQIKKLLS